MGWKALAAVALLALPLGLAPAADACSVPCGRIYPLITFALEGTGSMWNLTSAQPLEIQATLTFQFDMANEGYTVASPNEPVEVRFEYPRMPDWVDIRVEPDVISIPVNDPRYMEPDASDPTSPQNRFVFQVPIAMTFALTGPPVLKDGYDFAKLLVFAKSSESGLYQSGYGIKEIRVIPEGAVHESDVAGERDVFTAAPLPPLDLLASDVAFGGTTFALDVPVGAAFWKPAEFVARVDPAPAGRVVFAIHDEAGALVASTLPVDASAGEARLEATLAHPGRHTATLTLLPEPGSMTPPITLATAFDAGVADAEGYAYPKAYAVHVNEAVPVPLGSTADALAQFQRDIPFFVFESAQSVSATLTLVTEAPVDLGRSLANLQFSLHDPDGTMLQAGSVDPTKPMWALRVGSVAMDGWYVLRLKGFGAPGTARYDASVLANYAAAPQARNAADGAPDATGGLLARAGENLTLPVAAMQVWAPSDATPVLEGAQGVAYSVTIYGPDEALAYASGLRAGAATFTPQAPGTYRAFAYVEPERGAVPFSPTVRAFTFDVGTTEVTVARTFSIEDGFEAPFAAAPSLLGYHAVRVLEGASAPTVEGAEVLDADGIGAEAAAPGLYYLRVVGQGAPPAGSEVRLSFTQDYATPPAMAGPHAPASPGRALPIPGLAIAMTLAGIGALAIGIALARR